jgi:hypothetical protein
MIRGRRMPTTISIDRLTKAKVAFSCSGEQFAHVGLVVLQNTALTTSENGQAGETHSRR